MKADLHPGDGFAAASCAGVLVDTRRADGSWLPAWGKIDRYDGEGWYIVRKAPCANCGAPAGIPMVFHEDDIRLALAPGQKRCAKCEALIPRPELAAEEPERCEACAGSEATVPDEPA